MMRNFPEWYSAFIATINLETLTTKQQIIEFIYNWNLKIFEEEWDTYRPSHFHNNKRANVSVCIDIMDKIMDITIELQASNENNMDYDICRIQKIVHDTRKEFKSISKDYQKMHHFVQVFLRMNPFIQGLRFPNANDQGAENNDNSVANRQELMEGVIRSVQLLAGLTN